MQVGAEGPMQVGAEGPRQAFEDAKPHVATFMAPADWGAGSTNATAAATLPVQEDSTVATPVTTAGQPGITPAEVSCSHLVTTCGSNQHFD